MTVKAEDKVEATFEGTLADDFKPGSIWANVVTSDGSWVYVQTEYLKRLPMDEPPATSLVERYGTTYVRVRNHAVSDWRELNGCCGIDDRPYAWSDLEGPDVKVLYRA